MFETCLLMLSDIMRMTMILVHVFGLSRVDGCNTMLARSSKATTDCLLRVLNVTVRVVSGTHKFDCGLTHLLHCQLYSLDVPQCIQWLFVGACRAVLLSTLCTAVSLRLMLPVVSGSTLQLANSSSPHYTIAESLVIRHFLLQARQPGTRCQTISVIGRSAKTLLGNW